MDNVAENLTAIHKTLERQWEQQNEIMQKMLDIMPKPANKLTAVLETALLIVGISNVISIADILVKWIIGG